MNMIEVKTSELEGASLDWAVAISDGLNATLEPDGRYLIEGDIAWLGRAGTEYSPSTDWRQGGPLIEEYRVSIIYTVDDSLPCAWTDESAPWSGETPLIAACRAIVASKLGGTVQVPADLIGDAA